MWLVASLTRLACLAQPSGEPILRVETGVHTAPINRIATDAANRYVVTGSDDKTVRVWELATGRLLQTIRIPIGQGDEGKLYAVAISPDARTIACGGFTGPNRRDQPIYLIDRTTGRMLHCLAGLKNTTGGLVFSANGSFLAAVLLEGGLRVYKTVDGSLVGTDSDYAGDGYQLSFDQQGRLVTASYDGFIRLYDSDFKLLSKEQAPGGKTPHSVSFSPDGSQIAVGFFDSRKIAVMSGSDLAFEFAPDTTGVDTGDLSSVTWSVDGEFLFAGGMWRQAEGHVIRRWGGAGQGAYKDISAGIASTIMSMTQLQDRGVAFCTAEPSWGVINSGGQRTFMVRPVTADYRNNPRGFLLSFDGSVVQFGYELFGKLPARFSPTDRKLDVGVSSGGNLSPPRTKVPELNITDWEHTDFPKLDGKNLKLDQYEMSRALAIAPKGESFLLGTEWWLRLLDKKGSEKWRVAIPAPAWSVNIAGNGQVAAAAFGDGTIRWYRMRDGKELMAFYPHSDRKRWVLWTPSGYYDCSPGGEDLIGWHVNNGKDKTADWFSAGKFRDVFYRPDVLAQVLEALDEQGALRAANAKSERKPQESEITDRLPPVIQITAPDNETGFSESEVTVRYTFRTPTGQPVKAIRALVDSRQAASTVDLKVVAENDTEGEITVQVPPRDCIISVFAENTDNQASEAASVKLKWTGKPEPKLAKPTLYVLAIGVSEYENQQMRGLNLDYAAKDAKDFVDAVLEQKDLLYEDVQYRLLTDEKATTSAILDELQWIQEAATQHDMAMVFLSGHGFNDANGLYYFCPQNFNRGKVMSTGVPFSAINSAVQAMPGGALFFLDSCHSGNVMGGSGKNRALDDDVTKVINELASVRRGVIVFSSSMGSEKSQEHMDWENGAFTKAVVEGIRGAAATAHSRIITYKMLDVYVAKRVKILTRGRQHPVTVVPPNAPDYTVALTP